MRHAEKGERGEDKVKEQDKQAEIRLAMDNIERGFRQSEDWGYHCDDINRDLNYLKLSPDELLVLDAGCGVGTYSMVLAKKVKKVVGIDICSEATQIAKERADNEKVNLLPIVGDLESLPFRDESFDICFCGAVLHHFPDINPVIHELARVTKIGGEFALIEPNGSNPVEKMNSNMKRLMGKQLARAGFDTPSEKVHSPKAYVVVLEREGFVDIRITSFYSGKPPTFLFKSRTQRMNFGSFGLALLLYPFLYTRYLSFLISAKILPSPSSGDTVAIVATKSRPLLFAKQADDE